VRLKKEKIGGRETESVFRVISADIREGGKEGGKAKTSRDRKQKEF